MMDVARPVNDLERRFHYHPPLSEKRQRQHQEVRASCLSLASTLVGLLPDGREKSVAITKVEEAMFWANAALARQPDEA